jgi:hypothetical protein
LRSRLQFSIPFFQPLLGASMKLFLTSFLRGLRACGLAGAKLGLIIGVAAVNVHAQACQPFENYLDSGDGTVTDPRTGLMWKHCSEGAIYRNLSKRSV